MADIFISYVQEDGSVAREIADGLERAGYGVWYYERDSLPGYSYLEQILEVLDQAKAVIVILSPATLGSSQVNIEISEAHVAGKRFVPLLRGLSHATLSSQQRAWTMMFGTSVAAPIPEEGVAGLLPRLVQGLRRLGIEPTSGTAPEVPLPRSSLRTVDRTTVSPAPGDNTVPPKRKFQAAQRGRSPEIAPTPQARSQASPSTWPDRPTEPQSASIPGPQRRGRAAARPAGPVTSHDGVPVAIKEGPLRRFSRTVGRYRPVIIGLGVFILVFVLASTLAPSDPSFQNWYEYERDLPPFSEGHLLGTNWLGQDILSQLLINSRFGIAATAGVVTLVVGYLIRFARRRRSADAR